MTDDSASESRQRILDAATRPMAEHGYAATSISLGSTPRERPSEMMRIGAGDRSGGRPAFLRLISMGQIDGQQDQEELCGMLATAFFAAADDHRSHRQRLAG